MLAGYLGEQSTAVRLCTTGWNEWVINREKSLRYVVWALCLLWLGVSLLLLLFSTEIKGHAQQSQRSCLWPRSLWSEDPIPTPFWQNDKHTKTSSMDPSSFSTFLTEYCKAHYSPWQCQVTRREYQRNRRLLWTANFITAAVCVYTKPTWRNHGIMTVKVYKIMFDTLQLL